MSLSVRTTHKQRRESRLPEGYTVRPAQMKDAPCAVAMFNECSMHLMGESPHDINELRVEWTTPKFDLARDTRVILSPAGELVGYGEVWDTADPHVVVYAWGRVHPNQRGLGIGSFLLSWEEQRAMEAVKKAPVGTRVVVQSGALESDASSIGLLEAHGFAPVRQFLRMMAEMKKAPPAPIWAAGITVRTFERSDLQATVEAVRDSFSDHWGQVEIPIDQDLEEWAHWIDTDEDFDPSVWFLAEAEGDIVGVALCAPKRYEDPNLGWIHTLGVKRAWRKRGIALALLNHALATFHGRGKPKVGLGVDAESLTGATRLYERAGMFCERRYITYGKELRAGFDLARRALDVDEGPLTS